MYTHHGKEFIVIEEDVQSVKGFQIGDDPDSATWVSKKYLKQVPDKAAQAPAAPALSKREINRLQTQEFQEKFLGLLSDGQLHCLIEIGPVVGNTYLTGLSARVRALRKTLPAGLKIPFGIKGTPAEGTWYRIVKTETVA